MGDVRLGGGGELGVKLVESLEHAPRSHGVSGDLHERAPQLSELAANVQDVAVEPVGQPRVGDDPVEVLEGLLGGGFGAESLREFELELGDLRGEAAGGLRGGFKLGSKLGRDAISLRSLGLPPLGGLERGVELRLELRNLRGESGARLFDLVSARS